MAKANYLSQIRKRMDGIQKEYNALAEAYQILSSAGGVRGRKAKIPTLSELTKDISVNSKVKGKRGRPAGAKNKPGSKKPGPKTKLGDVAKSPRGRKPVKKKNSVVVKNKRRERNPNLSEKIREIVSKSSRFKTNAQITDKLTTLYPEKSRSDLGKYISVILSNMKARKELGVVTFDAKGQKMRSGLWGLPEWFEGDKPKAEFLR